jgi:hypothetical protein
MVGTPLERRLWVVRRVVWEDLPVEDFPVEEWEALRPAGAGWIFSGWDLRLPVDGCRSKRRKVGVVAVAALAVEAVKISGSSSSKVATLSLWFFFPLRFGSVGVICSSSSSDEERQRTLEFCRSWFINVLLLLFLDVELFSLFLVFQDSWEELRPRGRTTSGRAVGLKYISLVLVEGL